MPKDAFTDMTKTELVERASALNIEGRSTMSRDELEKAVRRASKRGAGATFASGRPDQGSERAVVYTDQRQLSRTAGEVAPGGELADQSSEGGTITGRDRVDIDPGAAAPVDTGTATT